MKKIMVASIVFCIPFINQAQLNNLLSRAKSKVEARINSRADQAIDKTLDNIEGKNTAPAKGSRPERAPVAQAPTTETSTKSPSTTAAEVSEKPTIKSYSKFDYIPGEKIIYTEEFAQDAIGELPTNWNASGKGEVMTVEGIQGKWLRLFQNNRYLTGNKKEFGENYTIEFDMIYYFQPKKSGYLLPDATFGFFASGTTDNTDNKFLKEYQTVNSIEVTLHPYDKGSARVESRKARAATFNSDLVTLNDYQKSFNKPLHYSIQVQKQRIRLWINETKVFDVPRAVNLGDVMNQMFFHLERSNYQDDEVGLYLQNIKVATGLPDTRHKLIDEGKFSTTGVLFDFQSSRIKQESYGVLKEIAAVLKENPGVKILVVGHTSNDGDNAANMELSKQRASAVKDILVKEYGIDASNITTDGKGPMEPVADNKTKEGKAQNRRVEFIKM